MKKCQVLGWDRSTTVGRNKWQLMQRQFLCDIQLVLLPIDLIVIVMFCYINDDTK